MCDGWYRKTFRADSLWRNKFVKLDFGGIIYYGDVYLNDKKIASTDYGYVGLEADLTPYINWEGDNVLKVYASTGPKKGSRWYTGGGLFRDVYLKVQNPTHIARHGIYITTKDNREVSVQAEVTGWQGHQVKVVAKLRDAEGRVVGTTERGMPKYTHQVSTEVLLPAVTLDNAQLWDIDSPYLYNADVLVYDGELLVDSVREQFGVRSLDFSPSYGFHLNGRKVFLQGNSGHHDLGALGAASNDRAIERMMQKLKEFGSNTIRCSHNPYSESFARIADKVGLLIVEEAFDKWGDNDYWGGRQPLTTIWPQVITEMVKRDRNRPSVVLWSLGNELQIRENWTGYKELNDWGGDHV
jgi:beta-galactosidase